MVALSLAGLALAALAAPLQERPAAPGGTALPARTPGVAQARAAADRALDWLVAHQNEDGSWGWGVLHVLHDEGFSVEAYYDYQVAAHALGCLALLAAPPSAERERALERAVDWLCATRLPKRGSDWDVDHVWAALYGTVALAAVARDERFDGEAWRARVHGRGDELVGILERNQVPTGGWAYYDDPPWTARPKWGTSFCTALVLPALAESLELGWLEDPRVIERARAAVRRSALPNGAFRYTLDDGSVPSPAGVGIDALKGSLGRTAVCLWGLAGAGEPTVTAERVREALDAFLRHHRFLDVARMRPYPHEAYYANSGYFYFFGHYYAALLIGLLPQEERADWHARLRPHLLKVQYADGSATDFQHSTYSFVSGTAYLALALLAGLAEEGAP